MFEHVAQQGAVVTDTADREVFSAQYARATPAVMAKALLDRVKPFDVWLAEGPKSQTDRDWYHRIVEGLRLEAGLVGVVS